nr:hypothetical protein [Synergistaceae bacterium]
MKKFLAVLLLVLSLASASHGAVSEDMKDIYVRQDVFDAKMEALFNRFHGEIQALGNEIKGEIKRLEGEIKVLGTRMDSIDKRMTSLETIVTWIFGLLSVVVAAIALTPLLKEIQRPKFTLDDVKLLIEENNAKFNLKSQK